MFLISLLFFFFNDTATTEIYTLSLHDALPICSSARLLHQRLFDVELALTNIARFAQAMARSGLPAPQRFEARLALREDRKSTRLNSSHAHISYAVFCLKKKKSEALDS